MDNVQEEKTILEILRELLDREDETVLKTLLIDLHPADIADAMSRLNIEERSAIFIQLDNHRAAEVLVELESVVRHELLAMIEEARLVKIIEELDSDDAADIIGEMDEVAARRILSAMHWEEFREVETLLKHEEDTAGGIMALEIVAVEQNKTARQAMGILRQKSEEVEDVYNIYVIDQMGVLMGIVSLKELVLASPTKKLKTIMDTEPIVVREDQDQEEVANLFTKYDLVAAPVVNIKGRLVGRITVDDVLEVVEEEASEDFNMMAGINDEDIHERSIFKISGVRLPWLIIAFIGQMICAWVLYNFEDTFQTVGTAVLFIPLVMAMGGNIGIQSATILLRGLTTGDIRLKDSGRRILREGMVGLLNAMVISLCLIAGISIFLKEIRLGLILGVALIIVLLNAALLGTFIPLFLKKIKIDPAIATGPFITTMNDIFGLLLYFAIIAFSLSMDWLHLPD